MEIISLLLSVSVAVFDFASHVGVKSEEKKKQVADFLQAISDTLMIVADKLAIDEVPHGACMNMRDYALALPQILDGLMEADKAQELSDMLLHAHNVEMLIIETREDKSSLERIRFASWRFNAAALILRMKQ